jgi:predicted  nucleic acid-binding Zn-ribbon protein
MRVEKLAQIIAKGLEELMDESSQERAVNDLEEKVDSVEDDITNTKDELEDALTKIVDLQDRMIDMEAELKEIKSVSQQEVTESIKKLVRYILQEELAGCSVSFQLKDK